MEPLRHHRRRPQQSPSSPYSIEEINLGSEYTTDQGDFLRAVDAYARKTGRRFLAATEFLAIAESLGWRRQLKETEMTASLILFATMSAPPDPGVTLSGGILSGTTWKFQGVCTSNGGNVQGTQVTFGGRPEVEGMSATVNADGTYSLTADLQYGDNSAVEVYWQDPATGECHQAYWPIDWP